MKLLPLELVEILRRRLEIYVANYTSLRAEDKLRCPENAELILEAAIYLKEIMNVQPLS